MKYRKKPVVIDAYKFHNRVGPDDRPQWLIDGVEAGTVKFSMAAGSPCLFIKTLEGERRADVGDWIIRGVKGELYPCKPDIFALTYESDQMPGSVPATGETPRTDAFANSCVTYEVARINAKAGEKSSLGIQEFIIAIDHARQLERENARIAEAVRKACIKVCDEQADEPECPERAKYCSDAIKALDLTTILKAE